MLVIEEGYDIFRTTGAAKDFSYQPIPGDFFDPGASDYSGFLVLQGRNFSQFTSQKGVVYALPQPSATEPENAVDTIVWRTSDIVLPTVGSSATIDVQMVHLGMSTAEKPIEIINKSGQAELWRVDIDATHNPRGPMTIRRDFPDGGHYDAIVPVQGVFTFTRLADGATRILDTAALGIPPLRFTIRNVPWMSAPLDRPPSDTFRITRIPGLTTNFVPGYHPLYGRVHIPGLDLESFGGGKPKPGNPAAYHAHAATSPSAVKVFA